MAQTPNGSQILAYLNTATVSGEATLTIETPPQPPQLLQLPSGEAAPTFQANNWWANALRLTNVSANANTPVWIRMFGPGMPGEQPHRLTPDTPLRLPRLQTATGYIGGRAQIVLEADSGELTTVAVIGGPADAQGNNAYLFGLNCVGPAPPGYTIATASNSCSWPFSWNSQTFVANLSAENSVPLKVTLKSRD